MPILLLKESRSHSLIDKDVKQVWVVSLLELLNSLAKLSRRTFIPQGMLLHCRTTNTVSIDDDLLWNLASIFDLVVLKGIKNESLELVWPIRADPCFLLLLWLSIKVFTDALSGKPGKVLGALLIGRGSHSNDWLSMELANIQAYKHSVQVRDLLR